MHNLSYYTLFSNDVRLELDKLYAWQIQGIHVNQVAVATVLTNENHVTVLPLEILQKLLI